MPAASAETTQVAVVGGGPAGLMLSHLLARAGVESIVLEARTHEEIRTTHRAGILEDQAVRLLTETGVDSRVRSLGDEHDGIDLRFAGESHPLDFRELVGATVTLYPQNEVFVDLAATRARDGGDVRFGWTVTALADLETERPRLTCTDAEGAEHEILADVVVGADGSRSLCRRAVDGAQDYRASYPFAWFGILAEAEKSAAELIYTNSPHGFALISQRSETVQRMYFQCDPEEDVADWSEDRIWSELQRRVAGADGFELATGPILEKTVLPFRSFVREPLRHGRLLLAGDAGHTVPPTGAKGLNLALADVALLGEALAAWYVDGDARPVDAYSDQALRRIWRAQHFSSWMTAMLHTPPDADPFSIRRALGELETLTSSPGGMQHLAECYTGWPNT